MTLCPWQHSKIRTKLLYSFSQLTHLNLVVVEGNGVKGISLIAVEQTMPNKFMLNVVLPQTELQLHVQMDFKRVHCSLIVRD